MQLLEKEPLKRRIVSILNMWTIAVIIVVILGGIYQGVMTPTEAAAAGVTLALFFSICYRKMTWQTLQRCMLNTVKLSTMVMFIVITASMIGGTLGVLQVPRDMVNWVLSAHLPPLVILVLIYFMYICLGCFFEGISMMVLTMAVIGRSSSGQHALFPHNAPSLNHTDGLPHNSYLATCHNASG